MKGKLLFLGTGASLGIPVIGCSCPVCRSKDPFNRRLRPSALIRIMNKQFLIDVGPDFRLQALSHGIHALDGILLTHAHHDHTAGMDDLRPIYYQRESPLPILLSHATAQDILTRYYYLFDKSVSPRFRFQILPAEPTGEVSFESLPIQYVTYTQSGMAVNGYRMGNLVYLSDIRHFSPSIFEDLKGVKILIISALRFTPSAMHLTIDEAVDFATQLNAEKVWLTHISHDLEHHQTNVYLPPHIRMAYDGLEIEFD